MAFSAKPSRGRGRGRGRGVVKPENDSLDLFGRQRNSNISPPNQGTGPWNKSAPQQKPTSQSQAKPQQKNSNISPTDPGNGPWNKSAPQQKPTSQAKPKVFTGDHKECPQEANSKRKELVKQRSASLSSDSSSEDDEIDDKIVSNILQVYGGKLGNQGDGVLSESKQNLQEACHSGANDCSVCLSKIRRIDAIWTCDSCFSSLHLQCIQKWAKEVVLQANLQRADEEVSSPAESLWSCPNCRTEYHISQCPRRYTCYCKKVENPALHPWLAPHTCGDTCGRPLQPECGHRCLLLCHPGPCPPCPQTVRARCHCGGRAPLPRRCSSRAWSCGQTCSRLLPCGQHRCTQPCHPGECPACPHTSQQRCLCGKQTTLRECASPRWECGQACGCPLPCGHHACEQTCHEGTCGDCPRAGLRHCPCGKTALQLECTEDIPACGDTCDKPLPCGVHKCTRRCHTGPCENCLQMSRKKCRCGAREKTLPCQEEYKCDHRCTKMRNCNKHQCKRRCCSGDCPPCEQQCNRNLPCGNHKCPSLCHPGRCYPCPLTVEMKCRCERTKVTVRCGREKSLKPPKCKQPCRILPDCHHPSREKHACHFGKCPPCRMACSKTLTCGHSCPKKCHAAVVHKTVENQGPRAPWKPAPRTLVSVVNEPCPPCEYPVPVECLGQHETSDLPCAYSNPYSCKRPCGRLLACTNHRCQFECHTVEGAEDDEKVGSNCQECEEGCSQERPVGCRHPCRRPCHEGPCPPCKKSNKMRCHCRVMALFVECSVWLSASEAERGHLASCKGPCPKQLVCGHPCSLTCHDGPCSDPAACTFKLARRCKCKRRKKDFLCHEVRSGKAELECDETCQQQRERRLQEEQEKLQAEEEEKANKEKQDLEEYNRLMNKRKRTRRRKEYVEETSWRERYGRVLLVAAATGVLVAFVVYLLSRR